jgi:hypothetical protein
MIGQTRPIRALCAVPPLPPPYRASLDMLLLCWHGPHGAAWARMGRIERRMGINLQDTRGQGRPRGPGAKLQVVVACCCCCLPCALGHPGHQTRPPAAGSRPRPPPGLWPLGVSRWATNFRLPPRLCRLITWPRWPLAAARGLGARGGVVCVACWCWWCVGHMLPRATGGVT